VRIVPEIGRKGKRLIAKEGNANFFNSNINGRVLEEEKRFDLEGQGAQGETEGNQSSHLSLRGGGCRTARWL